MTGKGEKMTDQGEMLNSPVLEIDTYHDFWQYPDFSSISKEEVTENELCFDRGLTGFGKEILLEDVYFWYGNFRSASRKLFPVSTSGSHIQMTFSLQSRTSYFLEISTQPFVRFKQHQHNLLLLPKQKMFVQYVPDQETEVFSINTTTNFFFNNLPANHPVYQHFKLGIIEKIPVFLSQRNLPVTPKMIAILFEILHNTYSGYHKSLFIKAKVIELLAQQFEQYELLPVPDITSAIKKEDVDKMHLAREILIDNIEEPLSIKDLAHQIGTNEFNLKKYFKEVYGVTVFGYLHDYRMQQSKELLFQENSKIAEVAQKMGYKHATHFTAAFKKHFGYLPTKIRFGLLHLFHAVEYLIELGTALMETMPTEAGV